MNALTKSLGYWLAGAVLAYSGASVAQDKPDGYPVRPIRLIISASPGAGGDMMARAVAQMLTDAWGQNAVVDSRPGGSGVIAVELVARSAPDGYTLLSLGDNAHASGCAEARPFRRAQGVRSRRPNIRSTLHPACESEHAVQVDPGAGRVLGNPESDLLGIIRGRQPRYISAWKGWRSYPALNCCSYLTRGPLPASSPPWEAKSTWWARARCLRPPR